MAKGKKKKLKSATVEVTKAEVKVHDRRTSDLVRNAKVAPVEVDDPYGEPGEKLMVMRSLRDDPLADMHSRKQIDECQYVAGRHWQKALELSEVGTVKAIDPSKEAVDGGMIADPISEAQRKAILDLKRVDDRLGVDGAILVRDVLGKGTSIIDAARRRGLNTEPGRKYLGKRFRECLDSMAYVLGYTTKKPEKAA